MVQRITTNGMMTKYKTNLMKSYNSLANVSERVTTGRNFNSYAESPTKAAQAFQLRRNRWNVENQIANSKQVRHKFQQAWDCLEDTYQDIGVKLGKYSALRADNAADEGGRNALGEVLKGAAESVMQTMNAKYGENFVFSGADGATVPFSWSDDGKVLYRGKEVDCLTTDQNYTWMEESIENEHTFVDLGMGMKEDPVTGKLIEASAFDTALNGVDYIGYGYQEVELNDGKGTVNVPNNIISLLNQMGQIYCDCDTNSGDFPNKTYTDPVTGNSFSAAEMAEALEKGLGNTLNEIHSKYIELDTRATFVNTNEERLESLDDSLNEQITSIEDTDPADAITALMWAQYSYNAALRIGTNLLSQSLLDYMS